MSLHSSDNWPPQAGESAKTYCERLEKEGFEEMWIRKAVLKYGLLDRDTMGWQSFCDFFEQFPTARMRHLALLNDIHPKRSDYSMELKVAKNLKVTAEKAKALVAEFRTKGPLAYR